MSYVLGIDIGTTFTAAAVLRGGHVQVVGLGDKADSIPSVVLAREDATMLTGEAAARRGASEPHRLAREFKRRFGQPEPILLGGTPFSAEALTAALLRSVVDTVVSREGGLPDRICLTHPANWGQFKVDLFHHVVRLADLSVPVVFTTEPEAAAVAYARGQRVDEGAVVAVYDLGGGTFDAAVLRWADDGFEILGQPEGIEQLGGIDVDAAVFHHVTQALGDRFLELDEDDPAAVAAVSRLRRECVDAKEALSADTDASVPAFLPGHSTEIRLTRHELEQMVGPMLGGTIDALGRALDSARVRVDDVAAVLLVGGASRMPLVAQMVGAELRRPVAVDAHPKHVVAVGAAWLAEQPAAPDVPAVGSGAPTNDPTSGPENGPTNGPTGAPTTGPQTGPSADPQTGWPAGPTDDVPVAGSAAAGQTMLIDTVPDPLEPPRAAARRGLPLWPVLAAVLVVVLLGGGASYLLLAGDGEGSAASDDPEQVLADLVDRDADVVEDDLRDRWVPQLFVHAVGADPDGEPFGYEDVLAMHEDLSSDYEVVVLSTADFPSSFVMDESLAILGRNTFDSADDVLAWCAEEAFAAEDCFAKRLSDKGLPKDNFKKPATGVEESQAAEDGPVVEAPANGTDEAPEVTPVDPTTEPTDEPTDGETDGDTDGDTDGSAEGAAETGPEAAADEARALSDGGATE